MTFTEPLRVACERTRTATEPRGLGREEFLGSRRHCALFPGVFFVWETEEWSWRQQPSTEPLRDFFFFFFRRWVDLLPPNSHHHQPPRILGFHQLEAEEAPNCSACFSPFGRSSINATPTAFGLFPLAAPASSAAGWVIVKNSS